MVHEGTVLLYPLCYNNNISRQTCTCHTTSISCIISSSAVMYDLLHAWFKECCTYFPLSYDSSEMYTMASHTTKNQKCVCGGEGVCVGCVGVGGCGCVCIGCVCPRAPSTIMSSDAGPLNKAGLVSTYPVDAHICPSQTIQQLTHIICTVCCYCLPLQHCKGAKQK